MAKRKRTEKASALNAADLPAPSETEAKHIAESRERLRARRKPASLDLVISSRLPNGKVSVAIKSPHSDEVGWSYRLHDAFGTASASFTDVELHRLLNALAPRVHRGRSAI